MDPRRRLFRTGTVLLGLWASLLSGCTGGSDVGSPGGATVSDEATGRFLGAELAAPYAMPDITLRDTEGDPFNLVTDTTSPITLVFFGYTHCPNVCSLVMADLTMALTRVPPDIRDQTQLLFITTDPGRDTEDVLRAYLDRFDPGYTGLTGDLADIVRAADDVGVAIEGRKRLPSGGYDVSHGSQVIGFAHDQAPVVWTEGTAVDVIVDDIVALAGP